MFSEQKPNCKKEKKLGFAPISKIVLLSLEVKRRKQSFQNRLKKKKGRKKGR